MDEKNVIKNNLCSLLKQKLDTNKVMPKKQFAEALGVSQAIVSKWLSGINAPDIEYIPKICELLNITFKEIFMEDNDFFLSDDEKEIITRMRNDTFINYVVRRVVFGEKTDL